MSAVLQVLVFLFFLLLVFLWSLAFWKQRKLAVGVLVGLVLAWIGAAFVGDIDLEHIPVWLPAAPFATIALILLVFGGLAWYWGREEEQPAERMDPGH